MDNIKHKQINWKTAAGTHKVKVADWSKLSHREWEEFRRSQNKIGGSDVATICGYNEFKDPLVLFYEKIGLKKNTFRPNELTAGGHADEQGILDRLESYDGAEWVPHFYDEKKFRKVKPLRYTFYNDDMPWCAFNMDGVIYDDQLFPDKGMGVAEFKKINGMYSDKFTGGVPTKYIPQVITGMEITGAHYGTIALLRNGVNLIVRTFHRELEEYEWWSRLIHVSCNAFYAAMLEGQEIVKRHGGKGDQMLDELLDVEARYHKILYVSANDKLGAWYSEMHNMREERGTAVPDDKLVKLVLEREQYASQAKELYEKKALAENKIKKWMRDRAAILAEDDDIRVGFRKNLTIKVRSEELFF